MKYLALFAAALLAGCGTSDDAQIRSLQARLGQAMAAREFDIAVQCYARDAVLLMPGQPRLAGREAIGRALRAAFADPRVQVEVRVERIEIDGAAQLAFAWGTGLTTLPGASQEARHSASNWLAVYRRRGGAWEIAADAFNEEAAPGTH